MLKITNSYKETKLNDLLKDKGYEHFWFIIEGDKNSIYYRHNDGICVLNTSSDSMWPINFCTINPTVIQIEIKSIDVVASMVN